MKLNKSLIFILIVFVFSMVFVSCGNQNTKNKLGNKEDNKDQKSNTKIIQSTVWEVTKIGNDNSPFTKGGITFKQFMFFSDEGRLYIANKNTSDNVLRRGPGPFVYNIDDKEIKVGNKGYPYTLNGEDLVISTFFDDKSHTLKKVNSTTKDEVKNATD